jgi:Protein of unknown function (DUF4199)
MNPTSPNRTGFQYGLITGVLYAILLFLRYRYFGSNPVSFGIFAFVSYIMILVMFLFTAIARRKELGGYGDFREIFTSVFIAILIAELFYVVFNIVYLKYIDPAFWENFRTTSLQYLQKLNATQEQIDQQMKSFKNDGQQTKPVGLVKGYGNGVIVDCVFGMIFTLILRRKKPDTPVNSEGSK